MRGALVAIACSAAVGLTSCSGMTCNLLYAVCGLTISVEGLPPGSYELRLVYGDRTARCTAVLPPPAPGASEAEDIGCDRTEVRVTGNDPFLDRAPDGTLQMRLDTSEELRPARVDLVVEQAGNRVLARTIAATYEVTEPNGDGCGECASAAATVSP